METITERAWSVFHEPLRQFIRKRVPDTESAEDLLQEVFLRRHTHIEALREEEHLQSWVYQIARNLIVDHYRKKSLIVLLKDADAFLLPEEMPVKDVRAELAPSIAAMVSRLPEPYREALVLTEYQAVPVQAVVVARRQAIQLPAIFIVKQSWERCR